MIRPNAKTFESTKKMHTFTAAALVYLAATVSGIESSIPQKTWLWTGCTPDECAANKDAAAPQKCFVKSRANAIEADCAGLPKYDTKCLADSENCKFRYYWALWFGSKYDYPHETSIDAIAGSCQKSDNPPMGTRSLVLFCTATSEKVFPQMTPAGGGLKSNGSDFLAPLDKCDSQPPNTFKGYVSKEFKFTGGQDAEGLVPESCRAQYEKVASKSGDGASDASIFGPTSVSLVLALAALVN